MGLGGPKKPLSVIVARKYRQGDQAGSRGKVTRTGKFWEEKRLSLQSSPRHRGRRKHLTDKRYQATWLTQTRIMG